MQFSLGVLLTTTLMVCVCAQKALNAQDFSVTGLDKYGLDDPSWSGMMPLDVRGEPHGQDGEFFFWLFESRSKDPDLPLIVWLNGGPGCSSTVGLVFENGPFKLKEGGEKGAKYVLEHNNYSWNEVGHTLYVEQPLRTGFSQPSKPKDPASKVVNELNVADDFYGFLLNFYRTFPRFQYVPLFLTGESYAGMYIPNIAQHIVERNVQKRSDDWDWDVSMKLQGVAIGNGAIDPLQDLSHAQYAYNHGLIPLGAKLAIESKVEMCTADGAVNVHEVARDSKNDVFESALDDAKKLSVVSECDTNMMVHVLLAAGQPNEYVDIN